MSSSRKVLIIKTGFSEFLDRGISTTVSLGDVLICTSILHLFKKDHVTWVTDWRAKKLLEKNPFISEMMIFGSSAVKKLLETPYDVLVNLEKDIGICTMLKHIPAKKRFGFYFDDRSHQIKTHRRATQYLLSGQEHHKDIQKSAYEILYETVNRQWKGQMPILGVAPRNKIKFDIGFNYEVGSKWPTKAWPMDQWKRLEGILAKNYSISWQQGHKDIVRYAEWINSCRLVVTSDSLGMILGQALAKKVVVLYGPTNPRRMQGINDVEVVTSPLKCPHMPCFTPVCKNDKFCMDFIAPEHVAHICHQLLNTLTDQPVFEFDYASAGTN